MGGIVDTHTHVDLLPFESLESMALAGIKKIVGCSFFYEATRSETLFDHFRQLLTLYSKQRSPIRHTPFCCCRYSSNGNT